MGRVVGLNRAGSVWIEQGEVDLLARHGLWYRVDFRDEFGYAAHDNIERMFRGKVRYLPILIWNRRPPRSTLEWSDWRQYVKSTVARYPSQRYWQVWNEPNNSRVANTSFEGDVELWDLFLRRTAKYIKAVNPVAKVVAGGIAVGGHGSHRITDYHSPWFNVSEIVDRVAVHTYCESADEAAKAINNARRVASQGVWVTELGRKSTVDGEDRQARWFRRVRSLTGATPLFWYDLQDVDGAFDGFGACRRDWSRKPVWYDLT